MISTDSIATSRIAEIRTMLEIGLAIDPELRTVFHEEAENHLRVIYEGLDRLQVNSDDRNALGDVRRAAHTLKGAAGAVGVPAATRLSHRMEDLLDELSENNLSATPDLVLLLLAASDRLQEITGQDFDLSATAATIDGLFLQFDAVLKDAGERSSRHVDPNAGDLTDDQPTEDDPELEAALAAFGVSIEEIDEIDIDDLAAYKNAIEDNLGGATGGTDSADTETHLRVPLSRLDDMVRLVGEMIINRNEFSQRLSDFTGQVDDMQIALGRLKEVSEQVESRCSDEAFVHGGHVAAGNGLSQTLPFDRAGAMREFGAERDQEFDELEFDRYNEFHLMARTLAEATSDVASITRECRVLSGDFDALLRRWQRLTRETQDRLKKIRMVPLRTLVPRLGRAVRSTAMECGKKVQLIVRGEHNELDKSVLEEIADPLLHLVRNSVDHGVETPDQRQEVGKPAEAMISIEVVNQGTQLTLRIEDDGRGLDAPKIRRRAIERGLITDEQELTDEDIHRLIFQPGFSTATAVTDTSGRGVGMDVVFDAVQRLKGTIRVNSFPGMGLRVTIILPTSLSVTRAVVAHAGGSAFAIPMQAISQITRLDAARIENAGDGASIIMGDQEIRLRKLNELLGVRSSSECGDASPMVILESGDRKLAVLVDEIESGQDIVVKSLGSHLKSVPGLIGATIRGDGSVIPILDPADLVEINRNSEQSTDLHFQADPNDLFDQPHHAMIVDDSVSVRRVTASVMKNGGWSVTTAKDGVDALEQLAELEQLPDVILLDMEMPRMDGLALLSYLRANAEYSELPIVMVTSRSGEKHRSRAMKAGASRYIVKPFRDDQLLAIASELAAHN